MQYFRENITNEDPSTLLNIQMTKTRTMDLTKINVRVVHMAAKHNFIELFRYIIRDIKSPQSILDA